MCVAILRHRTLLSIPFDNPVDRAVELQNDYRAVLRLPPEAVGHAARLAGSLHKGIPVGRHYDVAATDHSIKEGMWFGQRGVRNTFQGLAQDVDNRESKIGEKSSCLLYTSPSPRDRTRSRMP